MGTALKQPVVMENKAGAGGGIGMTQVAKAKPDGYTVLLALSSLSCCPRRTKCSAARPTFQVKDLKPIARFTADPTVLAVEAESPWKTYGEFIAAAKAAPGKLNFGSSGNYGTMHMPMAMLMLGTDVKMTHVPYTGAGPAMVGLLGGQVDALATGPATIVQHSGREDSRARALGRRPAGDAARRAEPEGARLRSISRSGRGCSCLPRRRSRSSRACARPRVLQAMIRKFAKSC